MLSITIGARNGETVNIIIENDVESTKKHNAIVPGMVQGTDDKQYLVLCTNDEDYTKYNLCTAEVKLERMLKMLVSDDTIGGLCFDPWGKGDCIVPRDQIMFLVERGDITLQNYKMM